MPWWRVVLLLAREAVLGPLNLAVVFVARTFYARGHLARAARLAAVAGLGALAWRLGWARGLLL